MPQADGKRRAGGRHSRLLAGAREGERKTLATFAADPYGCLTPALVAKREQRDPFASAGRYVGSCPELQGLLQHCGREFYAGPLPWAP